MLEVRNLTRPGLEPVSFDLATGEIAILTGPSGSGKSLMLRALADLDPNQGDAIIDGVARSSVTAPVWRGRVAYVPAVAGWWSATAGEHFQEGRPDTDALAALGLRPGHLDQPISELSTGERQRLAILRALAGEPGALLLDEPTSALDEASVQAVEALITAYAAKAVVVMTTHDPSQADRLGSRRFEIKSGALREIEANP